MSENFISETSNLRSHTLDNTVMGHNVSHMSQYAGKVSRFDTVVLAAVKLLLSKLNLYIDRPTKPVDYAYRNMQGKFQELARSLPLLMTHTRRFGEIPNIKGYLESERRVLFEV